MLTDLSNGIIFTDIRLQSKVTSIIIVFYIFVFLA